MLNKYQLDGTNSFGSRSVPTAYDLSMSTVNPMQTSSGVLGKAQLDGTNAFGVNSMPGAWGNWGNTDSVASKSLMGGIREGLNDFFGTSKDPGMGSQLIGAGQGLLQSYLGMQQFGLAKEKLAESKRQYAENYAAQRTLTNGQLEDRQNARVASNSGAYQSVGDYMAKNRVA